MSALAHFSPGSKEEKGETAQACEERRLGEAMAGISERYRDHDGLGKQELYGLLFREFARQGRLGACPGCHQAAPAGKRRTIFMVLS